MDILHHLRCTKLFNFLCTVRSPIPIPIMKSNQARKFHSLIWQLIFLAFDCLNLNILLSYSAPETRASLLQRHNIQLQHRGPHQPLLTVEMRPTQRFVRQVPQAFHEGSVAFIQTWDAKQWEGRQQRALAIHSN